MNSTKPWIEQGARLTNNNYHLFIDKDMNGPNDTAVFSKLCRSPDMPGIRLQIRPAQGPGRGHSIP